LLEKDAVGFVRVLFHYLFDFMYSL